MEPVASDDQLNNILLKPCMAMHVLYAQRADTRLQRGPTGAGPFALAGQSAAPAPSPNFAAVRTDRPLAPFFHPMNPLRPLLPLLLLLAVPVCAQVSELGITGGTTFYIGDINPKQYYPANTHLGGGLMYRYNFNERYAFRLQGLYGKLEAWDRDSDDPVQQARNLGFRSTLFEASAVVEVNFFKYRGLAKDSRTWTPFVFVGLAYFRTNPQNLLNDTWYDLQPLGTEGQTIGGGESYGLNQVGIPFGAGLKFAVTKRVDVQLEWGLRHTYTDYIDDVGGRYADNTLLQEQAGPLTALLADPSVLRTTGQNTNHARGDSQTHDWYQYSGLTVSLLLTRFTECDALLNKKRR